MKLPKIITSVLLWLSIVPCAFAGWIPAELISDENVIYHPRIASSGDYLHVVYSVHTGDDAVYYLRSIDGGRTWRNPIILIDTTSTGGTILPKIQTNRDTVFALWSNYFDAGGRNLSFRRSLNNGGSWRPIQYILDYNHYRFYMFNFCVSGRKVYVIFEDQDNGIVFYFLKSTDGGLTWSEPVEMFRCYSAGMINMASRGDTIHFVWYGNYVIEDTWETYYSRSDNGGANWSENQLLTEPDTIGSQSTSFSMNERGEMVVCWMDGKYAHLPMTGDLLVRYSYDAGLSWTSEEQITFNHLAKVSRIVWSNDSLHVVWEDERDGWGAIYYILSPDNGQTWKEEQCLDNDPERSEYPDIAISNSGRHVVWKDNRNYPGGVYYARWEQYVFVDDIIPSEYQTTLIAYPNPFNSTILISYSNLEGGDIQIYDITGRLVKTFSTRGIKEGPHGLSQQDQAKITWDATDNFGAKVCSGIYFVKAISYTKILSKKLVYLK